MNNVYYRGRVAHRLIVFTVLFSSLITLIATAIQLYGEYQRDVNNIDLRLEQIRTSYLQGITEAVWVADSKQLQIMLNGIREIPDIEYAEVKVDGKIYQQSGTFRNKNTIGLNMDLHYQYRAMQNKIGAFYVQASLLGVYQRLIDRVWTILISNAIKTFLVALFIYFVFNKLVTRHLDRIADFVLSQDFNQTEKQLTLDRSSVNEDELEALVTAINQMKLNLDRSFQALRQSEERFAKAFRSSPETLFISRASDGCLLEVNEGFERITGLSSTEVLGKTENDIGLWTNPDEHQQMLALLKENGKLRNHEVKLHSKSDQELTGLVSAEPIDLDGQHCLVIIIRDITEQKLAEQALAKTRSEWNYAMDFFEDAIFLIDLDGNILRANRAFYNFTNLTSGQVIEHNIDSILHPDGETFPCEICKAWRQLKDTVISMESNQPDNPTPWPLDVTVKVIRNEHAEPLSILMAMRNLTRQREIENELRLHRDNLEELVNERTAALKAANKELEAFSYSVSHDLRAPLRAITSYSQIVLHDAGDKLNAEEKSDLQRVVSAGLRLSQLIEDILRLSRISRSEFRREQVDISALAKAAVSKLREIEPERDVQISIQADVKAQGDARLLTIVLDNLFGNAWKYTGKTENAKIEFGLIEQNGEDVYFIRDNGAGFDMRYSEKLFGPFQRLHGSEFAGTGIGLATVQRVINRHGGRIWAQAEIDKGATFFWTLCPPISLVRFPAQFAKNS